MKYAPKPPGLDRRGVHCVALATLLAFAAVSAEAARRKSVLRRLPEQGQMRPAGPFLCPNDLDVLVVDDDDNDPDVRGFYTTALDALAVGANPIEYGVPWDTGNSDAGEPAAGDLAFKAAVVWFSGDAFTDPGPGFAGPGAAGEAALASYLDAGGCLLLSSQDHVFDHGLTAFTMDRFGVASVGQDVGHGSVTGVGPFAGLGPTTLDFPPGFFFDFSDALTSDGSSTAAFSGDQGVAALARATEFSGRAVFAGFPFEALPPADLEQALTDFFVWCGYEHPFCSNRIAASGSSARLEAIGFRAPAEGWVEISVTAATDGGSIAGGASLAAQERWALDNFVVIKKSEFFESSCGASGLPCSVKDDGSCYDGSPGQVQTAVFGGAVTPAAPLIETFDDADWQGGNPDPARWTLTGACFDPDYSAPISVQPSSPSVPGQEGPTVQVCPNPGPAFNPAASGSIALFASDIPGCQTTPARATLTVHLDVGPGAGQLEPGEDYLVQFWWGPRSDQRQNISQRDQLFVDILTSEDPFFEDGFESGDTSAWQ